MRRLWVVLGLVAGGFAVFVCAIAALWIYSLKHSPFYAACLEFARLHPALREQLGELQATSALPLGIYLESRAEQSGDGSVLFGVRGPNGRGTLILKAYRRFSHWVIDRARLKTDGETVTLATVGELIEAPAGLSDAELEERLYLAMQLQPSVPEPHFLLGERYLDRKEHVRAEESFRAAIARDGTFAPAYNDLGVALMGQRRDGDALTALRDATLMAPADPLPYVNQAIILMRSGMLHDPAAARAALTEAIARDAEIPIAHEILADWHDLKGDASAAAEERERAQALRKSQQGPDQPD